MRLEYIPPTELNKVWAEIKPGLDRIKDKVGGVWLVEDMFRWIKNGEHFLHIAYGNNHDYLGFITTQQEQYPDGVALFISATYSKAPHELDVLKYFFPDVLQWANNINAKRITFSSPRKGWEKNQLNFKIEHIKYTYELGE